MNKKFFTLIAAMLFGAFTVNAQIADTDGKYVLLKTASGYYLSANADSLTIKALSSSPSKADVDSALWMIDQVADTPVTTFEFTNKATGKKLALAKNAISLVQATDGITPWAVDAGKIYATYNHQIDGKLDATALKVPGGVLKADTIKGQLLGSFLTDAAVFTASTSETFLTKALTAEDLGKGLTTFALDIDGTFVENIFDGKQLIATDGESGYVKLQIAGEEDIANKPLYIGVDTIVQEVTPRTSVFGATFALDTVWTNKAGLAAGNAAFQQFRFEEDLTTGSLNIYVKDAPVFDADGKVTSAFGSEVMVVKQTVVGSTILTVGEFTGGTPNPGFGKLVEITFDKGTPVDFTGETGVYFIYYMNDGDKYYLYGDTSNATGTPVDTIRAMAKDMTPKATSPIGQFYVRVSEDGKTIEVADRDYGILLTGANPAELYEGADGSYRLSGAIATASGKDLFFDYQPNIAAGNPEENTKQFYYFQTINITEADAAKYAYTLNLVSGTTGVEDLYTFIKSDSVLYIEGQASADNAARFKVDANSITKTPVLAGTYTPNAGESGIGAIILGDTLGKSSFKLYKQFTDEYLYLDATTGSDTKGQLLIGEDVNGAGEFTFTYKEDGKYLMNIDPTDTEIMLDVDNGNLVETATNPNYFNLVLVDAPNYADFGGNGHKVTSSSEDDNKRLIKDLEGIDALLNFKADDENYSLYFQRANEEGAARPLYYISTQVGLTEEEKEDGEFFFLMNPAGYEELGAYDAKIWDDVNSLNKAVFMKGKIEADTLEIFGSQFGENVGDTVYKDMSGNPAVFAFATTSAGTLKAESALGGTDYYLQVINNAVLWTAGLEKAHEFNVAAAELIPTDNINPEAGFEVFTAEGGVIIKGAANQAAVITNVLGQTIAVQTIGSDYETISLPAGVAFITINGETVKAYVK